MQLCADVLKSQRSQNALEDWVLGQTTPLPQPKRKEGNVLFNDAINTFYLRLYGKIVCLNHVTKINAEGNVLFNDTLTTLYLRLYGITHMVKDHSDSERGNLLLHYMGYSFQLTSSVLLYAPSHKQDSTYHSLCYTSRGILAGTRNSSIGPP